MYRAMTTSFLMAIVLMMMMALYISFHEAHAQSHEKENAETMEISSVIGKAKAVFKNDIGQEIGSANLTETKRGVLIELELSNIEKGFHAFHIHETGTCAPLEKNATENRGTFTDAGGHFNPQGHDHGLMHENGAHAGDMTNLYASDNGIVMAQIINERITLVKQVADEEGKAYLFDDDGAAFIMHSGTDDYTSQPTGAAGSRIACAEIIKE